MAPHEELLQKIGIVRNRWKAFLWLRGLAWVLGVTVVSLVLGLMLANSSTISGWTVTALRLGLLAVVVATVIRALIIPLRRTPSDTQLANAMLDYWSSFARTGTPAATGQPAWPAYGSARAYMAFEDAPHAKTRLMPGMYELNEQVVCRRRAKGGIPWHWNVGLASPPLPAAVPQCR